MENATARMDVLRQELLVLHRAVIDAQRVDYERTHGRIETSGEFLGLVLEHPGFDWIRALSGLIARMDEWTEAQPEGRDGPEGLVESLRDLIRPNGETPFGRRYWELVETEPEVTMAHVKVWRLVE